MNALRKSPIRKLNPGMLQSDAEVREQFVVRQHELAIVLEVLRENIEASSCQHVLVVAPRGRGKTMLLARAAAELHADAVLSERLLPVRFMEESQEIFTLADFWLETLFHLARESAGDNPELARELRETHAALTVRWREETLGDQALAAVLRAADRLGKQLVLMVENLQDLCETVDDDFGWKLRGVLQSEPQIMLLATATSRFKGLTSRFKELDDAQQPFFELFRIVDLEPLSTEECRDLWRVISGDTVSKREMRPLEILTGGSPRLLVIVAGFGQHLSLLQLMEELVTLIDEHTEYFRSNMEVLAKTERRVYIAVIDLWQPSTTGEIATRARMDVRAVSALLGRLTDRGAVIWKGSGKKRQYVAAERLYSIYYKLRRERDEAAVVQNLIHFMVAFYSKSELAEMSGEFIAAAAQSPAIREGIERVVAELPELDRVFSSAEQRLQEILATFEKGEFEKVIETVDQVFTARSANLSHVPESLIARAFYIKAMAYKELDDSQAAIAAYDEIVTRFGASDSPQLQERVAWALLRKGNTERERGELGAAVAAYDEIVTRFGTSDSPEVQTPVAWALLRKGNTERERGELGAAVAAYDEVVTRFGTSDSPEVQTPVAWALSDKGDAERERGELGAAVAAYDEVVTRFGTSDSPEVQTPVAWALSDKGDAERERGELGAAVAAYDEVVTRFGASDSPQLQVRVASALSRKGNVQTERGHTEEALHTCEELERKLDSLPDGEKTVFEWQVRCLRTKALLIQENSRAAMEAFRSVYDVFVPDNTMMMSEMLHFVPDLIATGASAPDLVEILSSDKAKSDTLLPLIVALREYHTGEAERAPEEVREVAADIIERIEQRIEARALKEGSSAS